MSEKPDREKIKRELYERIESEVQMMKERVAQEEREFHVVTGGRLTIAALLQAGVIHEDCREFVARWVEDGGLSALEIRRTRICPPRIP